MPLVLLNVSKKALRHKKLGKLAEELPKIVAGRLNCPGTESAELQPSDVEVLFRVRDNLDIHNGHDVEITIFANDYPERRNLDQRRFAIQEQVKPFVEGLKGFVWVLLAPGSFGEF